MNFLPCKFCGEKPRHRMYDKIYHQYVCQCEHCTSTEETTANDAKEQWNKQNTWEVNDGD